MRGSSERLETIDQDADIAQRAAWLQVFKVQRTIIEQGIRERSPLAERSNRLHHAEASLPEAFLEDMPHLDVIADLLEDKLAEMLDVVLGKAPSELAKIRLPSGIDISPECGLLRQITCRKERRWLFIGGMQEILHHYRDSGRVLIMDERKRLLNRLSSDIQHVLASLDQLDSHLVVSLGFNEADLAKIRQFRTDAPAITAMYTTALGDQRGAGVHALLENSFNRFRIQFLAASAQLCLKTYGNVSIYHLRELWLLKSMYPLLSPGIDPADFLKNLGDTERVQFQRSISGALNRICKHAKHDSSLLLPILQLYRHNPRYGRDFVKKRATLNSEGLASAAPPTDDFGTSWIPGI